MSAAHRHYYREDQRQSRTGDLRRHHPSSQPPPCIASFISTPQWSPCPLSHAAQVTDCVRRGCAPPPPTTAFRRAADEEAGKTRKRVGHGAGKVRHMRSWVQGACCVACCRLLLTVLQVSAALLRQVICMRLPSHRVRCLDGGNHFLQYVTGACYTYFIMTAPQILGIESEERKQVGASVVKEGQEQSDKSVVRANDCDVDADGYGGLLMACVLMIH